jgi:hypothetical protein
MAFATSHNGIHTAEYTVELLRSTARAFHLDLCGVAFGQYLEQVITSLAHEFINWHRDNPFCTGETSGTDLR